MKKILQVRSEFRDNGPGTQSLEIAKEMKRRGYTTIFSSSGGIMSKEIEKDFKHVTIPTLAITKRGLVDTIKNIIALRKVIIDEEIDIIHGHNAAATYCAYLASKLSGRKVQITHSVRGMEIRKNYAWRNWIYRLYPATFFAVSGFTRDMLIDVGIKPEKIVTTYNGVDIERFDITIHDGSKMRNELGVDEATILIGQIGAFGDKKNSGKGQYVLVEAFAKIRDKHKNVELVFVGDGPARVFCEERVRELNIDKYVHFLGFRRDIPEIQSSLDIAVLASVGGEMFPNALLEAMAMGNPWVASNLSGIPEMAENGKNGLLAEPSNVEDLADKISILVENDELRKEMGKNAYKSVHEKYTIAAICNKIEAVYD